MLYANHQGLQDAARQLLFHDGQRELPVLPPAVHVLLFGPTPRPATVCCPVHTYGQPSAEQRLPLVSKLQQRPRTRHVLYSALRQVRFEINLTEQTAIRRNLSFAAH